MTAPQVRLDLDRLARIGLEEAIFCQGKSDEQMVAILDRLQTSGRSALLTRLSVDSHARLPAHHRERLDHDPVSRTAYYAWQPKEATVPQVAVLTAGSTDVPVAMEAVRTLGYSHVSCFTLFDCGVAGIWRLLERVEEIRRYPVAIVVAGMDAALPSVVGGLYPGLIVAVPTSVGYGIAEGGRTALNAILASCASGLATVNIDNGYGAACAALRALRIAACRN